MKALNLLLSSKGFPVKDRTAALIGMKMRGGAEWQITTLTGSLPLTYESRVEHILKNYALYGTASGAGVETENLFDVSQATVENWYIDVSSEIKYSSDNRIVIIPVEPSTTYRFIMTRIPSNSTDDAFGVATETIPATGMQGRFIFYYLTRNINATFTTTSTEHYIAVKFCNIKKSSYQEQLQTMMLVSGSTAPSEYIPFGYKIPLTNTGENSQSETYPLYIGSSKLGAEEYLDYETGKIYKMIDGVLTPTDPPVPFPAILTYQGENTLSSTETVGECSVTGRIKPIET